MGCFFVLAWTKACLVQVSQLLQKLRTDLHLSFHSFLKEFVAEPNDGVSWFLQRGPPCPVESSF